MSTKPYFKPRLRFYEFRLALVGATLIIMAYLFCGYSFQKTNATPSRDGICLFIKSLFTYSVGTSPSSSFLGPDFLQREHRNRPLMAGILAAFNQGATKNRPHFAVRPVVGAIFTTVNSMVDQYLLLLNLLVTNRTTYKCPNEQNRWQK